MAKGFAMKEKLMWVTRGKLASKNARPGIVHWNLGLTHRRGKSQRRPPRCGELRRYRYSWLRLFGNCKGPEIQYHCAYELYVSLMGAARNCPHPAAWPLDIVFNKRLNTVQEKQSSHSLSDRQDSLYGTWKATPESLCTWKIRWQTFLAGI